MKFNDLKTLRLINFYKWQGGGLLLLLPFIGYLAFGLANIYLFSVAIKELPTGTAFAVWTAATLIFIKIAESLLFHQRIAPVEVFFMFLIMIGILGLKIYAMPVK